jgi:hypothetical protein
LLNRLNGFSISTPKAPHYFVIGLARFLQMRESGFPTGFLSVANYSERIFVIAASIESYVKEHARAADTPEGIRGWWVADECHAYSLEDVEMALEYLVGSGRLARVTLADGTVIYTGAG